MITLDLKIRGAQSVKRSWDRVAQYYGRDMKPFFNIVKSWWFDSQKKVFSSRGEALGSRWAPLGALTKDPPGAYGRWKQLNHPGKPLMELSGALKSAMTGGAGSYEELNSKELKIGIEDIVYYDTHQHGIRSKNIPARPIGGTSADIMRDLDNRIQKKMNEFNREINKEAAKGMSKGAPGGMLR